MKTAAFIFVLALLAFMQRVVAAPTVGIESRVAVELPGTLLVAKPPERADKITVRIADTRLHGNLIHYDLRYIGLVPGEYDLRPLLKRVDGSATDDLPPMKVQIASVLPQDHQGQLAIGDPRPFAAIGGYKGVMVIGVGLWAIAAIFLFHRKKPIASAAPVAPQPPSLAERLRPLAERAAAGDLSADGKAELERMLLNHWQQRLGLENLAPSDAIRKLREHPEAGGLLRALEDWLHRRPGTARVDIDTTLAPYTRPAAIAEPSPV